MALYGAFSRHNHLSELATAIRWAGGILSPAARRLATLRNLTGSSAITLAGVTEPAAAHQLLGNVACAADVLAIPVTGKHVSKTTGADAEALTLANGIPGQILTVTLVVDGGGVGTLTPATATGWATVVFADAGDIATFRYIDDTAGWVIVGTAGVAAPPVISV